MKLEAAQLVWGAPPYDGRTEKPKPAVSVDANPKEIVD